MHWLNVPGALPVYLDASSPELSQLLSTLNSRVLLPHHLTPEQKKLVYKPANRTKLEQEPVEITLGDVTLPLEHIDRNKDVPGYKVQLRDIVRASKTPEDWENVVRALEGYSNAGIHLNSRMQTMVVRHLDQAGMQHLILKVLQRADATGVRLRHLDLILMVMRSVRDRAWQNDWDKDELKKALRMAEQVVELMDNAEHLGKPAADQPDYRTHPAVVAVPLEMAAELAYRYDAAEDAVKKYAPRFMNALKQHEFMAVSLFLLSSSQPYPHSHSHSHPQPQPQPPSLPHSSSPSLSHPHPHSYTRQTTSLTPYPQSDIQTVSTLASQTPASFRTPYHQVEALASLFNHTQALIPVWNALSASRTVLDAEMPMAADAERVQRQLRDVLSKAEDALGRLRVRDGKELARDGPGGYSGYVRRAVAACEEEEEA